MVALAKPTFSHTRIDDSFFQKTPRSIVVRSTSEDSTDPSDSSSCGSYTPLTSDRSESPILNGTSQYFEKTLCDLPTQQTVPEIRKICCVGAGYVGGPTAAVIALANPHIDVTVVDMNEARIRRWNSQHLPIHEPGIEDVVRISRDGAAEFKTLDNATKQARKPNLFFTTSVEASVAEADLIFISVNTPTKSCGIGAGSATNMVMFEGAVQMVARVAKPGAILVEKSTVPCRTAQMIKQICDAYRPGASFEILSNPEFLAEGTAIRDLLAPSRILIGSANTVSGRRAAQALHNVYASWVKPEKIITVKIWSSELTKLVANAMLAQRISSINAVSAICEKTGADIDEVAHVTGLDHRIGAKFLRAGVGFGGSCFKKDILNLVYLSRSLELHEVADYWQSVLKINEHQRDRFVARVVKTLNGTLNGKKITLFGYAFKANTTDSREAPAIEIVRTLLEDAPAEIAIFDPQCVPESVEQELASLAGAKIQHTTATTRKPGTIKVYTDPYEACHESSAVLIVTEWEQFRYPPRRARTASLANIVAEESQAEAANAARVEDLVVPTSAMLQQPRCDDNCPDCRCRSMEHKTWREPYVDWLSIADGMKSPKWVFDGRGVVVQEEIEAIGFRFQGIGKASSQSSVNGFIH